LARSHRITRLPATCAIVIDRRGTDFPEHPFTDVMDQRSTSAMRALYQFMKKLMPRLMCQDTAHDERDGFDGLTGLVQRRIRNRHNV